MAITKKQALKPRQMPRRVVKVPEWSEDGDEDLLIRQLIGSERDAYEIWRGEMIDAHEKDPTETLAVRAALVSMAACDERGEPLFTRDDVESLAQQSSVVIDRIYDAITVWNCMDRDSQADVRKNSKAPPVVAGCTEKQAS